MYMDVYVSIYTYDMYMDTTYTHDMYMDTYIYIFTYRYTKVYIERYVRILECAVVHLVCAAVCWGSDVEESTTGLCGVRYFFKGLRGVGYFFAPS